MAVMCVNWKSMEHGVWCAEELMIRITFSLLVNFLLWFKMDSPKHPKSLGESQFGPLISYHLRNLKVFSCTSTHICASLINHKTFSFFFPFLLLVFSFISTAVLMADGPVPRWLPSKNFILTEFAVLLALCVQFLLAFFAQYESHYSFSQCLRKYSFWLHSHVLFISYMYSFHICAITSKGTTRNEKIMRATKRTIEPNRHT